MLRYRRVLVEVLSRIAQILREKGEEALLAHEIKRAAMERIFGFELLTAPFVVAHLQIDAFIQQLGGELRIHPLQHRAVIA